MFFSNFALKSIQMANKTKSIFYTRQFVNMYSETVFIIRIVFNRHHIFNHWNACLFFWGIFIWANKERLTVDGLKSEFMVPEFMDPYELILMKLYDGSHCHVKFTIKLSIHAHPYKPSIFAPSTVLTSTWMQKQFDLSTQPLYEKNHRAHMKIVGLIHLDLPCL